jgi:hypothetical protein
MASSRMSAPVTPGSTSLPTTLTASVSLSVAFLPDALAEDGATTCLLPLLPATGPLRAPRLQLAGGGGRISVAGSLRGTATEDEGSYPSPAGVEGEADGGVRSGASAMASRRRRLAFARLVYRVEEPWIKEKKWRN